MEFVDPVDGAAEQVVDDLAPAEVENQRAPIGVLALARVFVLVERGAVEAPQAVLVAREVCRHPVHDDADAFLVAAVDEVAKVVGLTEAVGRREHTDGLVTPRPVERVFGHGQELDVRETHVTDVVDEFVGEFPVAEILVVALTPPGAEVHLVDAHRPVEVGR